MNACVLLAHILRRLQNFHLSGRKRPNPVFGLWFYILFGGPSSRIFYKNWENGERLADYTVRVNSKCQTNIVYRILYWAPHGSRQRIGRVKWLIPQVTDYNKQESPADANKPARLRRMQKLLQFDVFRFILPTSTLPNFKYLVYSLFS